jgi:hypothetical protein
LTTQNVAYVRLDQDLGFKLLRPHCGVATTKAGPASLRTVPPFPHINEFCFPAVLTLYSDHFLKSWVESYRSAENANSPKKMEEWLDHYDIKHSEASRGSAKFCGGHTRFLWMDIAAMVNSAQTSGSNRTTNVIALKAAIQSLACQGA